MENRFDELVAENSAPNNRFDQLAQQEVVDKTQAVKQSMYAAVRNPEPDKYAEIMKIAQEADVPTDLAARNFDELKRDRQFSANRFDQMVEKNPKLASWIEDPDHATLAKDDIDGLSNVEKIASEGGYFSKVQNALAASTLQLISGFAKAPALFNDSAGSMPLGMGDNSYDRQLRYENEKTAPTEIPKELYSNSFTQYLDEKASQLNPKEAQTSPWSKFKEGSTKQGFEALSIQAISSIPAMAAIMINPAVGLTLMGTSSAGNKLQQNLDKGIEPGIARGNAILTGVVEAGVESLGGIGANPFKKSVQELVKNMGARSTKEILKGVGKSLVMDAGEEGAEEVLTNFTQRLFDYGMDIDPNAFDNIGQTSIDAFLVGGAAGFGMQAVTKAPVSTFEAYRQRHQVNSDVQTYDELGAAALKTKLNERMPEKQREFMAKVVEGTPLQTVYLDPDGVDTYFQNTGTSAEEAMTEIGLLEQYQKAKESGADIQINYADWAHKTLGTEFYNGLKNDIKFDANGMTLNQTKAQTEATRAELNAANEETKTKLTPIEKIDVAGKDAEFLSKELVTQQRAQKFIDYAEKRLADPNNGMGAEEIAYMNSQIENVRNLMPSLENKPTASETKKLREKSVSQVRGQIYTQLVQTGSVPREAKHQALVMAEGIGALADSSGLTPEQIMEKFPLGIQAGVTPVTGEGVLNQRQYSASEVTQQWANLDGPASGDVSILPENAKKEINKIGNFDLREVDPSSVTSNQSSDMVDQQYVDEYASLDTEAPPIILRNDPQNPGKFILIDGDHRLKAAIKSGKKLMAYVPASTVLNQKSPLGFVSQLQTEVEKMDFKSMPAKDLAGRVKNIPGLKAEELEYTGFNEWLAAQEGKVTKEEVVEFLNNNGVKVEQVVLGEIDRDVDSDAPTEINFSEPEFRELSGSRYDYALNDEIDSKLNDEYWVEEETKILRESMLEDYTDEDGDIDEDGLKEAIDDKIRDSAEESAAEYISSEDYYDAEYVITESNTGFELVGNDERGSWYSEDARKSFDGNAAEAKIEFSQWLIENGHINADILSIVNADNLEFRSPSAKTPSSETIDKKVKALVKTDEARLRALVEADEDAINYRKDMTPEEAEADIVSDIKRFADREIRESYADANNAKNKITIRIDNPLVKGEIEGNNVKGYVLTVRGKESGGARPIAEFNLEAKTPEAAQAEAIQKMVAEKIIGPSRKTVQADGTPAVDVNRVVGKSLFKKYVVPGGENYREFLLTTPKSEKSDENFYYRKHFNEANILAHVRATDRVDDKGRKTLFVEEVQSDWHQQGRERGYKIDDVEQLKSQRDALENRIENEVDLSEQETEALQMQRKQLTEQISSSENAVPDAPFKNTEAWSALAMKRIIRLATEQGYEAVAWTPASVQVERWGTDHISWNIKKGEGFNVVDANGRYLENFSSEADAHEYIKNKFGPDSPTRVEADVDHWMVGSAEQRGGNADGMAIEEVARARGDLLEKTGERVTTKEELQKVISDTLGRERTARSLESLTETVWKQMQETPNGVRAPRKEGMEFFYDNVLPKKVAAPLLKKIDKNAKVEIGEFNLGNDLDVRRKYEGPDLTVEQFAAIKIDNVSYEQQARNVIRVMKDGESFAEAMTEQGSPGLAQIAGGKFTEYPKKMLKAWEIVLTPEMKAKAEEGFTLFQGNKSDIQGQIQFGNQQANGQFAAIISLFESKDLSTFMHEGAHYLFNVMGALSEVEGASQRLKDDYSELLKWLGVESRSELTEKNQEQIARGWEAYLMEGKAPTAKLKSAFANFATWLSKIYRNITGLEKTAGFKIKLTPEVRAVFDRMLMSEDQIQQAEMQQNYIPLPVEMMTATQREKYIKAMADANDFAVDELRAELMADELRKQQADYKEAKNTVTKEVTNEVNRTTLYVAHSIITKGAMPDGSALPKGTTAAKISRDSVVEKYGEETAKAFPRGTFAKNGVSIDTAAEMYGFKNAYDMTEQFSRFIPKDKAIAEAVEAQMLQRYPELLKSPELSEEAMKKAHNEKRAQVYKAELEFLLQNAPGVVNNVLRRITASPRADRIMKEQAAAIIGDQILSEIKPVVYQRAEAKNNKLSGEKFIKGDMNGALEAKRKAALNHELYRAANDARERFESDRQMFKKLFKKDSDLAKNRDVDYVDAARAVLAKFGMARAEKTAQEYLEKIQKYDADTYDTLKVLVDAASKNAGPVENLTFSQYEMMSDAVKALWDLSKTSQEITINGIKQDLNEIKESLMATNVENSTSASKKKYAGSMTGWEDFKGMIAGWKASTNIVEHWTKIMGGKYHDVFTKSVFEATSKYRAEKREVLAKYRDLFKMLDSKSLSKTEYAAPELGNEVLFKDKGEILGAILHTGNNSNLEKLLIGRGWGDLNEDGSLNADRWKSFEKRMIKEGVLTKADFDWAQEVWNLNESLKPGAWRAHKEMYGFYPNEVTANEFENQFGIYRGGYVPAKADPTRNTKADTRAERDAMEMNAQNSFSFPTTGRGATKSRVAGYNVPLAININMVAMHLDWALRFTHVEPVVKKLNRIVSADDFRETLNEVDTQIGKALLIPYLQRTASQRMSTPMGTDAGWKGVDNIASTVRGRVGMQVMGGNLINGVQNYTGLAVAGTLVKSRLIRDATWDYLRNATVMVEVATEKSTFMRSVLTDDTGEIQKDIQDMIKVPSKGKKANDWLQKAAYIFQRVSQNQVSTIAWHAAYNQALENGMNDVEAVADADSIVRRTQSSQTPEGSSRMMTGAPVLQLFVQFFGYFNNLANLNESEFKIIVKQSGLRKGAGQLFQLFFFATWAPAVLSDLLRRSLSGLGFDEDDDDEYMDDFMSIFFGSPLSFMSAQVPFVGNAANLVFNNFNHKMYDDRLNLSPSISIIESMASTPASAYDAIDKKSKEKKAIRNVMNLIGIMSGTPAGMLARPMIYLNDVRNNRARPSGPIDYTRGLVTGKPGNKD